MQSDVSLQMLPVSPTVPEERSSSRSAEVVSPIRVSSFGGASRVDFSRSQIYNIGGNLNNGFNHVLQPEQVTSQPLSSVAANQQPELETVGDEAEERDNEVYARLPPAKRRGFPLWYPTPDPTLPEEYLEMGNRIGDVGIITSDGYFDFLFNICLPSNHPINGGSVPEGFIPLEIPHGMRNFTKINADGPGDLIANGLTFNRYRDFHRPDPSTLSMDFDLRIARNEGALLILPDGSVREDLTNLKIFREYACQHGEAWYKYVYEVLGRQVPHNSIHLITGHGESDSWVLGAFSWKTCRPPELRSNMQLTIQRVQIGNKLRYIHCWPKGCPINAKYGPTPVPLVTNQCLFIRTFNIALNKGIWKIFFRKENIKVTSSREMPLNAFFPEQYASYSSPSYSPHMSNNQNTYQHTEMTESSHLDVPVVTVTNAFDNTSKLEHPSHTIAEFIFDKMPGAKIAVSHDSDWIQLLRSNLSDRDHAVTGIYQYLEPAYSVYMEASTCSAFLKPKEQPAGGTFKERLTKHCSTRGWGEPTFQSLVHGGSFSVTCLVSGMELSQGQGYSEEIAIESSALEAVKKLGI